MTILITYPYQTKKGNKDFFKRKNKELTKLDWAKWSGWFATDGNFTVEKNNGYKCELELKDKQPLELFSKIFECSLTSRTKNTVTPKTQYSPSKKYRLTTFRCKLSGEKAKWFTKNVYPYLLKEEKKDYAEKILGYQPLSKDVEMWTRNEITSYLGSAICGDGCATLDERSKNGSKYMEMALFSNDPQYLSDVKYIVENKYKIYIPLQAKHIYQTKEGEKTMYYLRFAGSQINSQNLPFFKRLIEDNVMTLDRKKHNVQKFITSVS